MRHTDRPMWFMLTQRLLTSGVRVADGEQADYYFIPFGMRSTADGDRLKKIVRYIRHEWPWWDRYHGGRHLLLHVGGWVAGRGAGHSGGGRGGVVATSAGVGADATGAAHWGAHVCGCRSCWARITRGAVDNDEVWFVQATSPTGVL